MATGTFRDPNSIENGRGEKGDGGPQTLCDSRVKLNLVITLNHVIATVALPTSLQNIQSDNDDKHTDPPTSPNKFSCSPTATQPHHRPRYPVL